MVKHDLKTELKSSSRVAKMLKGTFFKLGSAQRCYPLSSEKWYFRVKQNIIKHHNENMVQMHTGCKQVQ